MSGHITAGVTVAMGIVAGVADLVPLVLFTAVAGVNRLAFKIVHIFH